MASGPPTDFVANVRQRLASYTSPWQKGVFEASKVCFQILFRELRNGNFRILGRLSSVADEGFGKWYNIVSDGFARFEDGTAVPGLVASAHGIVLDLGACSGNQIPRLDPDKLKHVYGIEPNHGFAAALAQKIEAAGLEDRYTPIFCGIEDVEPYLIRDGVQPGTVDSIVCIQVLCCVKDPEAVVKQLHGLLRPGGEFIFWEHHHSSDVVTRIVQWLWNLVWPTVIGGCQIGRPTMKTLLSSAKWEVKELVCDELPIMLFPHTWGILVKPQEG